jgi:23S rRNA-intervening sequence protein
VVRGSGVGYREEKQMMNGESYRGLEVWQAAMDLVEEVYRLAALLPETEKYGLASQMRRAATSIPANIAEGYGVRTAATIYGTCRSHAAR